MNNPLLLKNTPTETLSNKGKTIIMKPTNISKVSARKVISKIETLNPQQQPMTEQLIAPPARVWEKIEQMLDEQDRKKRSARISPPLLQPKTKNGFALCFAALGATVFAGMMWLSR